MFDDWFCKFGVLDIVSCEEVLFQDVLLLIVCEWLIGVKFLESVQNLVEQWCDWVEDKVGVEFDSFEVVVEDQNGFVSKLCDVLKLFDMVDELGDQDEDFDLDQNEDQGNNDEVEIGDDNEDDGGE